MKTNKIVYTIVALIAAIGIALYVIYNTEQTDQAPDRTKVEQVPPIPEQALEKFNVTETEGGQPHWVLDAASAQIMEKEKKVVLQSPKIKFYEKGKYVSTLVADSGRINTENYDIWGDGKCLMTTAKGERLETSNLYYKAEEKKIITNDPVKLVRPGQTIRGRGMEASPDLSKIKIRNQRVEVAGTDVDGK